MPQDWPRVYVLNFVQETTETSFHVCCYMLHISASNSKLQQKTSDQMKVINKPCTLSAHHTRIHDSEYCFMIIQNRPWEFGFFTLSGMRLTKCWNKAPVSIWCLPLHWICLHPTELYHTFTSLCLLQRKSNGGTPVLIVSCDIYHNNVHVYSSPWHLYASFSVYTSIQNGWWSAIDPIGSYSYMYTTLVSKAVN